jgi:hypothetical protein
MSKWVKYQDLNDDLKEKAIDYIRENAYDLIEPIEDWYKPILDHYVELYDKEGFELNKSEFSVDIYNNYFHIPAIFRKDVRFVVPTTEIIDFLIKQKYLNNILFSNDLEFINDEIDDSIIDDSYGIERKFDNEDLYLNLDFDEEELINDLTSVIDEGETYYKKEFCELLFLLGYDLGAKNILKYKEQLMKAKTKLGKIFFKKIDKFVDFLVIDDISFSQIDVEEVKDEIINSLNDYVEEVVKKLIPILSDLFNDFKNDLIQTTEYYESDEYIKDLLENNDYEFEIECDEDECEIIDFN